MWPPGWLETGWDIRRWAVGRGIETSSIFVATPHHSHYCLSSTSYHQWWHQILIEALELSRNHHPHPVFLEKLSSVKVVLDWQMGWEPLVYRGVSSLMIITGKKKKKKTLQEVCMFIQDITEWFLLHLPICVSPCVCAQSCPTLCNAMSCSPPGFPVHGIL